MLSESKSRTGVTGFEAAPDAKIGSIGQGHLLGWLAMAQAQYVVMTGRANLIHFNARGLEKNVKAKLQREI